jgi:hypothetical protein
MINSPLSNAKIIGENVDPRVYHAPNAPLGDPALTMSASQLKAFLDCPEEWMAGVEDEGTKATDFGNMVDCLLLTPKQWDRNFFVTPATYPDAKTGEQKAWTLKANYCKDYEKTHGEGKQIVKASEFLDAEQAVTVLNQNALIRDIVLGSKTQVHVISEYHDETGLLIPLKSLIDLVPTGRFVKSLIDFKTCRSVHPRAFRSHVHEYGYALSAALYLDAYNAATGESREDFRFIIQKNAAPWTTGLRFLNKEWVDFGRRQYVAALQEYANCLETSKWPSHEQRAALRGEVVIDGFMQVSPEAWQMQEV